eukprot:Skav229242  [mRNA]  locus=scaffold2154:154546:157081:+ [translate_table: standard]
MRQILTGECYYSSRGDPGSAQAIHLAASRGLIRHIQVLVDYGASVHAVSRVSGKDNFTALHEERLSVSYVRVRSDARQQYQQSSSRVEGGNVAKRCETLRNVAKRCDVRSDLRYIVPCAVLSPVSPKGWRCKALVQQAKEYPAQILDFEPSPAALKHGLQRPGLGH